ncbi:uncharacterized protein MELLADRAFT_104846 [Melampsora larici-populina 98AG31]|uniref:Uncharacterized protein n=1 Tax=Melampsora larici-populina (strain 98AG31 / pathotype 3-4-7) TaxID=747676 RepID=F4RFY3_MELLP|nr:uncharacterized protein MELLADRAFT_104846 [Melampsora larici-populina 98AG31]EGG08450.1 hypothetical protein MELLADRAFT_104846 [Melampsora larici-populina 98AG31]
MAVWLIVHIGQSNSLTQETLVPTTQLMVGNVVHSNPIGGKGDGRPLIKRLAEAIDNLDMQAVLALRKEMVEEEEVKRKWEEVAKKEREEVKTERKREKKSRKRGKKEEESKKRKGKTRGGREEVERREDETHSLTFHFK